MSASANPLDASAPTGAPTVISEREAYRNPWMVVKESHLSLPDGSPGLYGVVHKPTGVVVIAWRPSSEDARGDVLLVNQYRFAVGRRSWEFVAGTAPDLQEEEPSSLAVRELAEETGYHAHLQIFVGTIDVAPGFTAQRQHIFLMKDVRAGTPSREATEQDIEYEWWPYHRVIEAISRGHICDAQTLAAWTLVQPLLTI